MIPQRKSICYDDIQGALTCKSIVKCIDLKSPDGSLEIIRHGGTFSLKVVGGGGFAPVVSVNGLKGVVMLTTSDIPEGTRTYFTQQRARESLVAGPGINYDPLTGTISVQGTSLDYIQNQNSEEQQASFIISGEASSGSVRIKDTVLEDQGGNLKIRSDSQGKAIVDLDLDLNHNKMYNAIMHPITTQERLDMEGSLSGLDAGMMVFDTDYHQLYIWNGNQWLEVASGNSQEWQQAFSRSIVNVDSSYSNGERTVSLESEDGNILSTSWQDSFIHNQSIPSNEWVINHNLNKHCSVTIVDSANTEIIAEIEYISMNQCIARFAYSFSGKAFCN